MGILDDIENMKSVSDKVFTLSDLIKIFNKVRVSSNGNINTKRYKNKKSNYQMSVYIGKGDGSTIIKCSNGVKITIDKSNINDFIINNDEVSKIVEKLKKEIVVGLNNDKKNENSKEIGVNKLDNDSVNIEVDKSNKDASANAGVNEN